MWHATTLIYATRGVGMRGLGSLEKILIVPFSIAEDSFFEVR